MSKCNRENNEKFHKYIDSLEVETKIKDELKKESSPN